MSIDTNTSPSSEGPTGGLDVRPASGHIGADIHGVDLAAPLDDRTVAGIRAALLRWKVVFFREQKLDHAGQIAFARRFGEPIRLRSRGSVSPAGHPEIETTADRQELGRKHGMDQAEWLERRRHSTLRGWHADHTARIDPPALTLLRAERVPPYGGDTTWANLASAYAGLSEPVRRFADGLRAEHRLGVGYLARSGPDPYLRHLQDHQVASVHPVVRVHPETGERILYVNPYYVENIVDVTRAESRLLLEMFVEQITRPEYTVRLRWEPGSVALWDNRATVHLAPNDTAHLDFPRIMHRVMVAGDPPVGVDGTPSKSLCGTPLHDRSE
ncbi:TauD/TfdA family dioxygenase [Streptomyces sp. NBC_00104]|uniref:TauD/TfdA dioxygenase family protein n=1 Tax=unclassified Streptomyces TaxID=2593676 RepID=UPI002E1F7658